MERKEAILIAPKEAITTIGDIIAKRVGELAYENGIGVDYAIEQICKKCGLLPKMVDSVTSGIDFYIACCPWSNYNDNELKIELKEYIVDIKPFEILDVIRAVAEYFNTTTDYILGLTDRAY